ncbi:caspase family protein [Nocardia cyriacigeorgica]|nr:caspase family protein [Nocardia cyriacigeorgica]
MRLPDPARSWAVLLGTSTFDDTALPDIPAVRNNLADLAEVLTSPWATALPGEHCVTLADESDRAVIGSALNTVAAQAQDLLLVYYAGHGLIGPDGSLYLSLPNTRSDRNMVSWTALPFELVRRTLATASADNRVLILDCCFSGLAVDLMTEVTAAVSGQITVAGTCTLTSSPANRPSIAPVNARHTAYTGELLALLQRGPTDPGTELLTLTALHQQLEQVLPAKGFPRPEQRNTRSIGQLALARRRAVPGPASAQHSPVRPQHTALRVASADASPRRGPSIRRPARPPEFSRRRVVVAATASLALAVVLTMVVSAVLVLPGLVDTARDSAAQPESTQPTTLPPIQIPAGFVAPPVRPTPLPDPVYCRYKPDGKEPTVKRPDDGPVSSTGIVRATINTGAGAIPLLLDRSLAPCTVHSFLSLVDQGAFEQVRCAGDGSDWITCGRSDSPGYGLESESFTELKYRRGYLMMEALPIFGATFDMLFADTHLVPEYTVFGTISYEGLEVIDSLIPPDYDGRSEQLNNLVFTSIDIEE